MPAHLSRRHTDEIFLGTGMSLTRLRLITCELLQLTDTKRESEEKEGDFDTLFTIRLKVLKHYYILFFSFLVYCKFSACYKPW